MNRNAIVNALLAGTVALLLAGCEDEKYELKFSHYIHVTDNGMACDECHGELGQPAFKPMSHKTCIDCHDEPEAEEIGPETCGYCHEEKQLPLLKEWKAPSVETNRTIFVHTEALAGKCQECHASLMDEKLTTVPGLQRGEIVQLRDVAHTSAQDCMACHTDMARDQRPASHDQAWQKRHGLFGVQTDAACSVCHSEDSCKECHSVMQPVSHNNLFRRHTHGAVASWNRESCATCHEEDSCQSCHANTRPRSHNARWGAPGYKPTHCIGCHNTSTPGDGCATCHEGGNDVLLHEKYWGGAPINHNQPGIENCYLCHWTSTP